MNAKEIVSVMSPEAESRGYFVVEVTISADNDITLVIESVEGTIMMEDCVAMSNRFHELYDQEQEDYSLTVTSAGLDQPFKVARQYQKALNTDVEVRMKGGRKLIGTLLAADEDGITLKYSVKEAVPGKKKKEMVEHEDVLPFSEINSVTPHIVFGD